MRVSILTDDGEIHSLEFDSQMELENIKALLEADCNIPADEQLLIHNETELRDPKSTLAAHHVAEDDILTLRRRTRPGRSAPAQQHPQQQQQQQRQQLPGAPGVGPAVHPGQISQGPSDPENAEQIRQHVLSDPALLQQLAEQALNANPFDMDAQARIEEAIRLENVAANLEAALEYNPESFGRVTMLYIEVEVNGHPVKAFVDSGAQATIMSPECAEACGIMRLVDRRFAGIARGVGVAKILGRVHSAQIRVGQDLFLACSFTIMEGKGVDLLFGLDMLKRHQACIDLAKNALIINDIEVKFLSEHELPSSAKENGELSAEELATIGGTMPTTTATTTTTTKSTSSDSSNHAAAVSSSSPSSSSSAAVTAQPSIPVSAPASTPASALSPALSASASSLSSLSLSASTTRPNVSTPSSRHPEQSIETLMGLGVSRADAIAALDAAEGNVDAAAGFLF
ncbi:DNA damage-inducible protein 1 [Mortierella alpina]|uniref:DNA damage-inducible protein 1 n=1 Tax=Mortierella alpina TaxID=64518 RepID=A0A9P6JCQ4_MORAP|nr:DNA damage-inducible protein 1 [Mortierella alpina]